MNRRSIWFIVLSRNSSRAKMYSSKVTNVYNINEQIIIIRCVTYWTNDPPDSMRYNEKELFEIFMNILNGKQITRLLALCLSAKR